METLLSGILEFIAFIAALVLYGYVNYRLGAEDAYRKMNENSRHVTKAHFIDAD